MLACILTRDIKLLRLREDAFIPVGRAVARVNDAVRGDSHATELGLYSRAAEQALNRTRVTKCLLGKVTK